MPSRCHIQLQIQRHQSRKCLRSIHIRDIIPRRRICLGGENNRLLPLRHLITDVESHTRADTRVSVQKTKNLAILSLDILLKLPSSDRKGFEEVLDGDCGALLAGYHRGCFELAGYFEVQSLPFRRFGGLRSRDVEGGDGAQGRERLTAESECSEGG